MARIIQTANLKPDSPLSRNDNNWIYNGLDVCVALEVFHAIQPQLDGVTQHTYDFARQFQGPVFEMSSRGIRVDEYKRQEVLHKIKRDMAKIGGQLDQIIGEGIGIKGLNWRSTPQLKKLFYEVLGLKAIKARGANGAFSATVNRDALEKLVGYFIAEPICSRLLFLRDLDKKRTFLETNIDADGRIRTSFNIAGTNTGRLASSMSAFSTGTNLQNVDRDLRACFVADPGYVFVNLDAEQADARNVGALCWDIFRESHGEKFAGAYLDLCESGDLHTRVARMVWSQLSWGEEPNWRACADQLAYRSDSYRQLAKKLGHGTNYVGTPPTMAKHTHTPVQVIRDFQSNYFNALPCIPAWHEWVRNQLKTAGTITHLLGRRRAFFGRAEAPETLREAVAYGPQGMTADEIDIGILRLYKAGLCQILLQVHDSTLVQVPEDRVEELVPKMIKLMPVTIPLRNGRDFTVPIEAKVGWNWGDHSENNADGLLKWKGALGRERSKSWSLTDFQ